MKASRRERRREEILDVATELLAERGYRDTTMLDVAARAAASKETLYAWFGDKAGLYRAAIDRNAARVQSVLRRHLEEEGPVETVLTDFGAALLELLLGEDAVAINRAAIAEARSDPTLAQALAKQGRESTLPIFVALLESRRGVLDIDDAKDAAEVFLGLLLRDAQIRRLLGVADAPTKKEIGRRAQVAARSFLKLYGRQA